MKIITLTNQKFLVNELKKLEDYNVTFIDKVEEFYHLDINERILFFHHLDCDEDINKTFLDIGENFSCMFVALRNNTNNIEGCSLLKKGYKAYIHSLSNISILENVIETIKTGNTWVYPELMQFLINSIPLNETNKNSYLEELSVKELEVLELVAQGLSNAKIANTLSLAEVTVKKYISSLFKKFDVSDRLALALVFKNQK